MTNIAKLLSFKYNINIFELHKKN